MMGYGFGLMGLWGPLMMVLFWGGVVVLVVWAVRGLNGRSPAARDDAMDILRRRLAAGEITQDDYDKARKVLQG